MTTAQYREPVLNRDNHCCVKCEESRSLHVHHVIPRKLGGSDELSNLITLCAACHKLHGDGTTDLGPDLTDYERHNLEFMLLSIVDPSAAIREGYLEILHQD